MRCGPQTKGKDSPKVSEAGKNSKSTTNQQHNKVTTLDIAKHSQGSSASTINSDSRIQELVRGDVQIQSKTYGDATKLESISLRDLHPRSWYSVAWYPIYRIPDGNFRASFLTFHSLGHLVCRSSNSDSPTLDSCVVSPAVGLQSYNAQGECWFQLNQTARRTEMLGINPSVFLKERLRTLEETASLMARADVNKGNQICTNRHPDYEFFVSRRRY